MKVDGERLGLLLEGNALFGQWTWSKKGISPKIKIQTKLIKFCNFKFLKLQLKPIKII